MMTAHGDFFLEIFLEGFLCGKIFVLYASALTCTLAKEVQLFPGLLIGLYSGIFAVNFQCQSNKSRTATIVFHAVCLLHVLSTLNFVVALILEVSNSSICKNIKFLSVV